MNVPPGSQFHFIRQESNFRAHATSGTDAMDYPFHPCAAKVNGDIGRHGTLPSMANFASPAIGIPVGVSVEHGDCHLLFRLSLGRLLFLTQNKPGSDTCATSPRSPRLWSSEAVSANMTGDIGGHPLHIYGREMSPYTT